MFNEIHNSLKPEEGVIGAHYLIGKIAKSFTLDYLHVKDWDEQSEKMGCSDWEECILKYANEIINEGIDFKAVIGRKEYTVYPISNKAKEVCKKYKGTVINGFKIPRNLFNSFTEYCNLRNAPKFKIITP